MSDEVVFRELKSGILTFSRPFSRFSLFKIGARATLVPMKSKNYCVFAPISLSASVRRKLDDINGQVKYIIAPDLEHHLYVGEWKQLYPNASVIGVEGLDKKRKDVHFDYIFSKNNAKALPKDFTDEFDTAYFDGFVSKDLVLYHKVTKSLMVADLLWNLPAHEQYSNASSKPTGGLTALFNSLNWRNTTHKRFLWYLAGKDRDRMRRDAKLVASWNIETIIPCHGDIIAEGGKAWREAYAWYLK